MAIEIDIRSDSSEIEKSITDIISSLKSLDKSLKKTDDSLEDVTKQTDKLAKATNKAGDGAKKAAKDINTAGDRAKSADQKIEGLKNAAEGAGGKFGELAGQAEKFGKSAVSLGPIGAALVASFVGMAVSIGAAVGGVVGAATAFTSLQEAAAESIDTLKELKIDIPQEDINNIEKANASLAALSNAFDLGKVTLASATFTEDIENLLIVTTAFVLQSRDYFIKYQDIISTVFSEVVKFTLNPYNSILRGLLNSTIAFVEWTGMKIPDSLKNAADAANKALDPIEKIKSSIDDAASSDGSFAKYVEQAKGMIKSNIDFAKSAEDAKEETDKLLQDLERRTKKAQDAMKTEQQLFDEEIAALQEIAFNEEESLERRDAARELIFALQMQRLAEIEEAEAKAREKKKEEDDKAREDKEKADKKAHNDSIKRIKDEAQEQADSRQEYVDGFLNIAEAITDISSGLADKLIKDEEKRAKVSKNIRRGMMLATKAAAIAQAIIQGLLLSVTANLPPPDGIGFPQGGIAAGIQTGITVAAIAGQAIQEFPNGGMISSDHRMIAAQENEAILNRRAVRNLGEEGVNALNNGQGMGQTIVVQNVYKHKVFDTFIQDNIKKGGPLFDEINKNQKSGRLKR